MNTDYHGMSILWCRILFPANLEFISWQSVYIRGLIAVFRFMKNILASSHCCCSPRRLAELEIHPRSKHRSCGGSATCHPAVAGQERRRQRYEFTSSSWHLAVQLEE